MSLNKKLFLALTLAGLSLQNVLAAETPNNTEQITEEAQNNEEAVKKLSEKEVGSITEHSSETVEHATSHVMSERSSE